MTQHPSWNKVFIIGLPRTGTTSVCVRLLQHGLYVAHTAFTKGCFTQAQVIADVPIFAEYAELDKRFPNSKFVYLDREISTWSISMKRLLGRMEKNLTCEAGGFYPLIKQSYNRVFQLASYYQIPPESAPHALNYLADRYAAHQRNVTRYFANQPGKYLRVDVCESGALESLMRFLELKRIYADFPHINKANKITYWKDLKHPLKVFATSSDQAKREFIHQISDL